MVQHANIDHTGLPGIGGGVILQIVTANSTANDTTTAATLQASSLSAVITPLAADSILMVQVFGECNATRAAGTLSERSMAVAIRNTTNSVTLAEQFRGRTLIAASGDTAGSSSLEAIALCGFYTVNSTTARTFQLQFRATVATNIQAAIRGDRTGGVWMIITELAA